MARLGAVQAQDYAGAKWALGQRTTGATDADLDRLFDEGAILRTHVMRPTWHFVAPADIRWLLALTAPRVRARLAYHDRGLGIDAGTLRRAHRVLRSALARQPSLTRREIAAAFQAASLPASGQALGNALMHAELDGMLVSGPRRGRQLTWALLEERVPPARSLDRDLALAELTRRYFTGRGPAQASDFAWWSGLTAADAKRGLELAGTDLRREEIDGKQYWSAPDQPAAAEGRPTVRLLPSLDELLVAYRDRTAAQDPARGTEVAPSGGIAANVVVVNGRVRGAWKRRVQGGRVLVELGPPGSVRVSERAALRRAAADLGRFLGLPATLIGV